MDTDTCTATAILAQHLSAGNLRFHTLTISIMHRSAYRTSPNRVPYRHAKRVMIRGLTVRFTKKSVQLSRWSFIWRLPHNRNRGYYFLLISSTNRPRSNKCFLPSSSMARNSCQTTPS